MFVELPVRESSLNSCSSLASPWGNTALDCIRAVLDDHTLYIGKTSRSRFPSNTSMQRSKVLDTIVGSGPLCTSIISIGKNEGGYGKYASWLAGYINCILV